MSFEELQKKKNEKKSKRNFIGSYWNNLEMAVVYFNVITFKGNETISTLRVITSIPSF